MRVIDTRHTLSALSERPYGKDKRQKAIVGYHGTVCMNVTNTSGGAL